MFGYVWYKYVPNAMRRKLEDKSMIMVLVGYHPTRSYKLYNPATNEICISRDVMVNEEGSWSWTNQNTKDNNSSHTKGNSMLIGESEEIVINYTSSAPESQQHPHREPR